jgi:hypothetical protein
VFCLLMDPTVTDAWFLDTPITSSGDEWAFWRLFRGEPLSGSDLSPWQSRIRTPGRPLSFSFAGFDVPIGNADVAKLLANEVPDQAQLIPLSLPQVKPGYHIIVATRTIRCVDERNSEFTTWGMNDGRPDKVGEYRMFTRLRLDRAAVPVGVHMFRVAGWPVALVVSAWLAVELRNIIKEGLVYEPLA